LLQFDDIRNLLFPFFIVALLEPVQAELFHKDTFAFVHLSDLGQKMLLHRNEIKLFKDSPSDNV
jgi:hypothetical protein